MASDGVLQLSRLDLASSPSAVRWGRRHASDVLDKWGAPDDVAQVALLIVSELLTNVIRHARRPLGEPGSSEVRYMPGTLGR